MRVLGIVLSLMFAQAAGAATLHCKLKNGAQVSAKQSRDWDRLFDIQVTSPKGEVKTYPSAYAAKYEKRRGKVSRLVIMNPGDGVIASLKDTATEQCVLSKNAEDEAEMALINLTPPAAL